MKDTSIEIPPLPPFSLADALAHEAVNKLPANIIRGLKSDVASLGRWTGTGVANLPADPVELRPVFQGLSPGGLGITRKRIANVKSGSTRLLDVCGIGSHSIHKHELSVRWRELIAQVHCCYDQQTLSELLPVP